jgi:hypothetical protein
VCVAKKHQGRDIASELVKSLCVHTKAAGAQSMVVLAKRGCPFPALRVVLMAGRVMRVSEEYPTNMDPLKLVAKKAFR